MSKQTNLRADAARNREKLIQVAREKFLEGNASVTLNEVAEVAQVGIGTLYRHFPTREALVEAVYRTELDALMTVSEPLLRGRSAHRALRLWMNRYTAFVATKHAMYDMLQSVLKSQVGRPFETRVRIGAVIAKFLTAGAVDGTIRSDIEPDDVAVNLASVVLGTRLSTDQKQLGRLLDLLMDGLGPRP